MLSRRQFAIGSAAVASGDLVGGGVNIRLAQSELGHFIRRLPIPPLIDAAKQGNAVKLKATSGRHAFLSGKPTWSYGYSGPVLGPAIRLRRGDEVEMTVENALDVDTTVHWHGLLMPGDVDGGPHQIIKSGGAWRLRLKVEQPASTARYHPHLHHDTARQVYMGLTGLIIVDDGSEPGLGLPRTYGIDDLPLIIQDRSFDSDGSICTTAIPTPKLYSTAAGATPSSSMASLAPSPGSRWFSAVANSQCPQCAKFRPAIQRPAGVSRHSVRRRIPFNTNLDEAAQGFSRRAVRNPCRFREPQACHA